MCGGAFFFFFFTLGYVFLGLTIRVYRVETRNQVPQGSADIVLLHHRTHGCEFEEPVPQSVFPEFQQASDLGGEGQGCLGAQPAEPHPHGSCFCRSGWELRICISAEFPGDADALRLMPGEPLSIRTGDLFSVLVFLLSELLFNHDILKLHSNVP